MLEHSKKHDLPVKTSSDRSFGFVFAGFFLLVGLWPLFRGGDIRIWAVAVAAVFLLLALVFPASLGPANRLWMRFGALLHRIVSPVVLGILFYLVVTPTGLVMRMLRADLLSLRFDRDRKSYWIERTPPGPTPSSLKDQF